MEENSSRVAGKEGTVAAGGACGSLLWSHGEITEHSFLRQVNGRADTRDVLAKRKENTSPMLDVVSCWATKETIPHFGGSGASRQCS